jgi:hypothetical protein
MQMVSVNFTVTPFVHFFSSLALTVLLIRCHRKRGLVAFRRAFLIITDELD